MKGLKVHTGPQYRPHIARRVVSVPKPCNPLSRQPRQRPFPPHASGPYDGEDDTVSIVTEDDEDIGHLWPDDIETCFFLDSADLQEWDKWAPTGFFHGFTTNPTILRRDNVRCTLPSLRELTRQATSRGAVELQLQAWGSTDAELYSRALDLYELEPSMIVVKLPMTMAGLKAAYRLVDDEVPFTLTAVHSVHQVPVAIAAGAAYIAPYLGRMTDSGKDGMTEILKMQGIVDQNECRLLVASIRSAQEVGELAAQGANTFTVSPQVAEELVMDPLTAAAAELFEEHAAEMGALHDR